MEGNENIYYKKIKKINKTMWKKKADRVELTKNEGKQCARIKRQVEKKERMALSEVVEKVK